VPMADTWEVRECVNMRLSSFMRRTSVTAVKASYLDYCAHLQDDLTNVLLGALQMVRGTLFLLSGMCPSTPHKINCKSTLF